MWEQIPDLDQEHKVLNHGYVYSARLKVPGGWLVRSTSYGYHGAGVAMHFVDDPSHGWKLED